MGSDGSSDRRLREVVDRLCDRIADLEDDLEEKDERIDELEGLADATRRKTNATRACLTELQARKLEKGAHLRAKHVDEHEIDAPDGRLERITNADGALELTK